MSCCTTKRIDLNLYDNTAYRHDFIVDTDLDLDGFSAEIQIREKYDTPVIVVLNNELLVTPTRIRLDILSDTVGGFDWKSAKYDLVVIDGAGEAYVVCYGVMRIIRAVRNV